MARKKSKTREEILQDYFDRGYHKVTKEEFVKAMLRDQEKRNAKKELDELHADR